MGSVEKLVPKNYSGPNVGETVYLKSGSPPLTVTMIFEETPCGWHVGLTWINGGGHHQETQIPVECVCTEPPPWRDWYERPE